MLGRCEAVKLSKLFTKKKSFPKFLAPLTRLTWRRGEKHVIDILTRVNGG